MYFIEKWYSVLAAASENPADYNVPEYKMRLYLSAGFLLSDFYCQQFIAKTDEAYRRRSFGRAITNDAGTVVQSLLNLANAGKDAVTAVGVATGLADSAWRHYDSAFMVSADLSNVQSLVHAAKDSFRARTLGPGATLPADYATAQSAILRYANICSFLGMQDLLNRSAAEQRERLNRETEDTNKRTGQGQGGAPGTHPVASAQPTLPTSLGTTAAPSVTPALTPNAPTTSDPKVSAAPQPVRSVSFVGRWGDSGERAQWSAFLMTAVSELGQALTAATFVPSDISTYCPDYRRLDEEQREIFWAALLSSLAKRESNYRPTERYRESFKDSTGQYVVSRGLLQLSYESARAYGCDVDSAAKLHEPNVNLRCGVRILNRLVPTARAIAKKEGQKWRGAAAYWGPFRKATSREDIAAWVREQPYCSG
ncbi:lytic transglycosylase domain-containing protein [Sphingosinicella sp. BN140058]|uniref:lytic transglycosylase domain-containing protein n=1 Tax=Sphingosinicella sp. BN140058 TaxID=1892855 RepID=UPI001013B883|nr:lytic transglycosylase domain-containing protein [Sphingosinicella sp. BN140058]QAY75153.1 hypothetical protein ETR14_00365 [Sphingosinicella sp. BN140058]